MARPVCRRTVLRGAFGVTVTLPFLDSLVPKGFAAPAPDLKFLGFHFGNGIYDRNNFWFPTGTETDWKLSPAMQPLAAHKQDLTIIEGLVNTGMIRGDKDSGQYAHQNEIGGFLSGECYMKSSSIYTALPTLKNQATSIDQLFADTTSNPIKSLVVNSCPQSYQTTNSHMSYRKGVLVPQIGTSNALFEKLFMYNGSKALDASEQARRVLRRNILDHVLGDVKGLKTRVLGVEDKAKLDEYLTAVEEVQRSVITESGQMAPSCTFPTATEFAKDTNPKDDALIGPRIKNMIALSTLALQCGITRVVSFVFAQASGGPVFKNVVADGAPDAPNAGGGGLHWWSHYRDSTRPPAEAAFKSFNIWEMMKLAQLIDRLKGAKDGFGNSVFDSSLVLCGSGLGDGNNHSRKNAPTIITGRANGRVRLGRFVKLPCDWSGSNHFRIFPGETPRENMLAGIAQVLGLNATIPGATGVIRL
jgi:hypothetical protein